MVSPGDDRDIESWIDEHLDEYSSIKEFKEKTKGTWKAKAREKHAFEYASKSFGFEPITHGSGQSAKVRRDRFGRFKEWIFGI